MDNGKLKTENEMFDQTISQSIIHSLIHSFTHSLNHSFNFVTRHDLLQSPVFKKGVDGRFVAAEVDIHLHGIL